jgi:hypothetical protein
MTIVNKFYLFFYLTIYIRLIIKQIYLIINNNDNQSKIAS